MQKLRESDKKLHGRDGYLGNETIRERREIIERQLAHILRLDDDILDLSRIRQGKIELQQAWGKDVILIALNGWGQEEDRRERSRIRSPYA